MKFIKQSLILLVISALMAASSSWCGEIAGEITSENNSSPIGGANVFLEHTTLGSTTNLDGQFNIRSVCAGKYHLIATMIGYKPFHQDIEITDENDLSIDIQLKPTILELGAVVVTGTGTRSVYEDMPVRTEVIPRCLIEQKQAVNLADVLTMQTGVRVENNCNNCNFSQLRIHGLDGKYSQILIDGDPVVSSLTSVYGLEHFPEEMIEQLEIVKGGGSALYGGGAIGGTVNLITRKPQIHNVRIRYLGSSMDGVGDNNVSAVVQTVNEERNTGAYIFGSVRQRNPFDYNDDGISELGLLKNSSVGFNFFHDPFDKGEINIRFHKIVESRRGGNKFDRPNHEAEISESVDHDRWGGTARWNHTPTNNFGYRVYYSFALERRDSYYGGLGGYTAEDSLEALSYYGKTNNPLHVGGLHLEYNIQQHSISAGVEYSNDQIDDKSTADPDYYIDETYRNMGVFLQDQLRFGKTNQLEIVAGARMDKHSEIDEAIISPRVAAKWKINEKVITRATFSTGFKAPQTFDEDLHLCGLEGDQRVVRNDDDLKTEHSHSFSGGIEYSSTLGNAPYIFAVSVFHTKLNDVFNEEYVGVVNGVEIWRRINSDGAHVTGFDMDFGVRPFNPFECRVGITYKQSEYDEPLEDFNTTNFLRTPDFYGNLRISYDVLARLNLFVTGRYTGQADIPHEVLVVGEDDPELRLESSDEFVEFDLGVSYRIPSQNNLNSFTKVNFGVKNILDAYQSDLDEGFDRDPAYVYGPSLPRTFYVGLELSF